MEENTSYPDFLSSLNESQLIAHINSLSQVAQNDVIPNEVNKQPSYDSLGSGSFVGTSTPVRNNIIIHKNVFENSKKNGTMSGKVRHPFLCSASSLASDPFDDSLDSQLLKLDTQRLFKEEIPKSALVSSSSLCSDGAPIPGNQLALFLKSGSFDAAESAGNKVQFDSTGERYEKRSFGYFSSLRPDNSVDFQGHLDEDIRNDQDEISDEETSTDNDEENGLDVFFDKHSQVPSSELLNEPEKVLYHEFDDLLGFSTSNKDQYSQHQQTNVEDVHHPTAAESPMWDPDATMFAEVGPQHDFGDYDTYFQNKYRKQQVADLDFIRWEKQRRVENGQSPDIPRIFADCRIFVNGNTTPTLATIHKLVILHGGNFLSYLMNKGAATHIICDRLTPRKRIQFRNYRVVKAQWISDCVKQEKLLDWKAYRLIDNTEPYQKRLAFSRLAEIAEGNHAEVSVDDDFGDVDDVSKGDFIYSRESDSYGHNTDLIQKPFKEDLKQDLEDRVHLHAGYSDLREDIILDVSMADGIVPNVSIAEEIIPNVSIAEDMDNEDWENVEQNPNKINHFIATNDLSSALSSKVHSQNSSPQPHPSNSKNELSLSQLKSAQPRQAFAQMDAKHPDFLKHFFANSRLHHLSTWKADLKSKFLRLVSRGIKRPPRIPQAHPVILHIDFDCFFATVSALKHPYLDIKTDAIAVSHGGKSSDIASCNYVARAFGVFNGMWLGRALEQCAQLKVLDYEFESYEKFSHAFYSYLVSKKSFDYIFPVSIDEVLVDATSFCHGENVQQKVNDLCAEIRHDVFSLTGCTVSIGASSNVLLAKLAIKKAKPNGAFYLHEDIEKFLDHTEVRMLPGIGRSLASRLAEELGYTDDGPLLIKHVKTLSKQRLTKVFGEKTGLKIYENCLGIDSTSIYLDSVTNEALLGRKTVSVDVNYGIRFDLFSQAETFLISLAKELHSRLIDLGACGSAVTLRLARRAPDAPTVTPKFMGLGKCVFVSRTSSLGIATNDWGIIGSEMKALFRSFNIPPEELRGIAVSMSKLEDIESVKRQRQQKLEFTRKTSLKTPSTSSGLSPAVSSQMFSFAEQVTCGESVDWNVFNLLPEEIRRELKKELLRRGIPVSGKEKSPAKSTPITGSKVYLQQMFPTQPHGEFKVKRVIESPTKKKKFNESPVKTGLGKRCPEPLPAPHNDTISYDEDVLNEIPSSIREEFMEELEWQKKQKRLGFVSMKTKIERKNKMDERIRNQVIDKSWLNAQPRAVNYPDFAESLDNYHELVLQLRKWISQTAAEEGPHPEDVEMFENYLTAVFDKGGIARVSNLLGVLTTEVRLQENISRLCAGAETKSEMQSLQLGIQDWRRHLARVRVRFSCLCEDMGSLI